MFHVKIMPLVLWVFSLILLRSWFFIQKLTILCDEEPQNARWYCKRWILFARSTISPMMTTTPKIRKRLEIFYLTPCLKPLTSRSCVHITPRTATHRRDCPSFYWVLFLYRFHSTNKRKAQTSPWWWHCCFSQNILKRGLCGRSEGF